jgi:ABC-type antimicrobial peptide transport system permease subunit
MKISDLIKMGLRNLFRRKVRTLLTVLGVVIGTLFIVIMRSIGHGMNNYYETQVMQNGSANMIQVDTYGDVYDSDGNWVSSKQQKLDDKLVEQIRGIEHVKAVTPVISTNTTLLSGKYRGWGNITAIDMSVAEDFGFPALIMGEYPTEEDNSAIVFGYNHPYPFYDPMNWRGGDKVIDLTKDKIILKFDQYMPSGKKKEFALPLTNIAKMEETKSWEYDDRTYMDIDYFKEIYLKYCNTLSLEDRKKAIKTISEYSQIRLTVDSMRNVEKVQDKINEMGYTSFSYVQMMKPTIEASDTLQLVMLGLGLVSLFISAISIANTMVMAIYERTKEIGIMKVLGCIIKDIKKLFLFEAGLIGFMGGVIGVILAYIFSFLINKYGQPIFGKLMPGLSYMYNSGTTAATISIIPPYLPLLALAISTGVGIVFGYFPARRATKISAIEAMKNEA